MEKKKYKKTIGLRKHSFVFVDLVCIILSVVISLVIRYEALVNIWPFILTNWTLLLLAPLVRLPLYYYIRLYRRMWRYASKRELRAIVLAGGAGTIIIFILNFGLLPLLRLPFCPSRSVILLEGIFSTVFLGCTRFLSRLVQEGISPMEAKRLGMPMHNHYRILIAGAGGVGAMILREIQKFPADQDMRIVGFIDDNRTKLSMHIRGVPVLGNREDLPALVKKHHIDEVIVAMPTAPPSVIDDIYHICSTLNISVRTLPSIFDILTGSLTFKQLRQLRSKDNNNSFSKRVSEQKPIKVSNIMVTGGAGFIGSNFVHYMLEKYPEYRIIVFDKLTYAGNLDNLKGLEETYGERYNFVKGDICDYGMVKESIENHMIDVIVNFAAESHVDRSLMDPDDFFNTNLYGTYLLLKAAKHYKIKRFHQISTDEVYGQVIRGAFAEEDPLETRNPYSACKAGADMLVHAYCQSFGVPTTITRGSNNIGPFQYPEKAVPLFIINALENNPLPVYGDGLYVRDYQYVVDHCRGIDLVLHKGKIGEIYNLGGGNEVPAMELAKMILDRLTISHSLIRLVNDRPGQDRRYSLNCSKIKALGWIPKWTFDKALDDTIQWYIKNEEWWRKLKNAGYWKFYEAQYHERLNKSTS